ncbi:MAG: MscL family protein [Candidatus Saccharibacteria bacterium]|nr:MscL family protein [Candidatus Saccharibacteria bacterium]
MADKKATKRPALKKPSVAALKKRATAVTNGAKGHGAGFMEFIRTQGVVGLAVGLAIGTAAGDAVKKLVIAFIDPIVQLIVGSQEGLQAASFTVEIAGRKGEFLYGAFISSLITLLAVAFVVYAIIHFLKLDKLDKKKD